MDCGGELNPLASPLDNKIFLRFLHMSGKNPLKFQVFQSCFGCVHKFKWKLLVYTQSICSSVLASSNIYVWIVLFVVDVEIHVVRASAMDKSCVYHWY